MSGGVKRLLKSLLPARVVRTAFEVRGNSYLAAEPRRTFNPANLRSRASLQPETIFADTSIAQDWFDAHAAVIGVFGDEDMLGGVNPGDRRALYYLMRALKPCNVLEVGTHIGASTLFIARALKENRNTARVSTVDVIDVNDPVNGPWKQIGLPMAPKDLATQIACLSLISFHATPSLDFLKDTKDTFDFVFLDGDHRPHTVYREVGAALEKLAPGGVILLHDYYPDAKPLYPDNNVIAGPFRALARIVRENPEIAVLPLGKLPWPTKQGVNRTSLALITRA
jgi:predicted O-methyltransferase YrrM